MIGCAGNAVVFIFAAEADDEFVVVQGTVFESDSAGIDIDFCNCIEEDFDPVVIRKVNADFLCALSTCSKGIVVGVESVIWIHIDEGDAVVGWQFWKHALDEAHVTVAAAEANYFLHISTALFRNSLIYSIIVKSLNYNGSCNNAYGRRPQCLHLSNSVLQIC